MYSYKYNKEYITCDTPKGSTKLWPVTQEKLRLNLNDVFGSKIISM